MLKRLSYICAPALLLLIGQGCVSLSGGSGLDTTGPGGVFVSTDQAETWTAISRAPGAEGVSSLANASVYTLEQDPNDPKALYWGSRAHGLFFSYDSGQTWQRPTEAVNSGFVYDIDVSPHDTCTIYAAGGGHLYRTTDCNRHWGSILEEPSTDRIVSVSIDAVNPQRLYLAKRGGDLLRSDDGGISWQILHRFERTQLVDVVADPFEGNVVYVSTLNGGLYRSFDGGDNWESLKAAFEDLTGARGYRDFLAYPGEPGVLYWVSTYGILRSDDRGTTWEEVPILPSPGSTKIYGFAVNPQNEKEIYFTATVQDRSTFYKTVDGGENWITKRLPSSQLPTEILVHATNDNWIYLGFTIPPN